MLALPRALHTSFSTTPTCPQNTYWLLARTMVQEVNFFVFALSDKGIQVYDMMGPDTSTLKDVRTKSLRIAETTSFNKDTDEIFLVLPGTINLNDPTDGLTGWKLHQRSWVHFSFEDSPDWSLGELAKLSLDVYKRDK